MLQISPNFRNLPAAALDDRANHASATPHSARHLPLMRAPSVAKSNLRESTANAGIAPLSQSSAYTLLGRPRPRTSPTDDVLSNTDEDLDSALRNSSEDDRVKAARCSSALGPSADDEIGESEEICTRKNSCQVTAMAQSYPVASAAGNRLDISAQRAIERTYSRCCAGSSRHSSAAANRNPAKTAFAVSSANCGRSVEEERSRHIYAARYHQAAAMHATAMQFLPLHHDSQVSPWHRHENFTEAENYTCGRKFGGSSNLDYIGDTGGSENIGGIENIGEIGQTADVGISAWIGNFGAIVNDGRGADHAASNFMMDVDDRRGAQSAVDGATTRGGQDRAKHSTDITGSYGDVGRGDDDERKIMDETMHDPQNIDSS